MQPFPFQVRPLEQALRAVSTKGSALLAWACGGGKTFGGCHIARALGVPMFVICPIAVKQPWRRMATELGVPLIDVMNPEKLKMGGTPYLKKHDRKKWQWLLAPETLVVWDEVHQASGVDTINAYMCAWLKVQKYRTLLLSGTPAQDPMRMRALGFHTGMHSFTTQSFYSWARQNGCYSNPWNGVEFTRDREKAKEILTRINRYLFPEWGSTLDPEELKRYFKELQITAEAYETEDLDKIYEKLEHDLTEYEVNLARKRDQDKTLNPLTLELRARQAIELAKVPALAELAKDAVEEGMSVCLFLNFIDSMEALRKVLGLTRDIRGGQSEAERRAIIDDFLADRDRIVMAQVDCGGVGVELDDKHGTYPRLSLISPPNKVVSLRQCIHRIHRATSKSVAQVRIVFGSGSVEDRVMRGLQRKLNNLDLLVDGDLYDPIQQRGRHDEVHV